MQGDKLIELASRKPVLCDGAMGTMLQSHGLQAGACPELWNAERPDAIRAIHTAYIEAGARVISTNTFGANRLKLESYEIGRRARDLNVAGVAIARDVAGDDNFVAASIGPTGKFLAPLGDLTVEQAANIFAEQASAQAEAGADIMLLETFSDLDEAKVALKAALKTGLPSFCTMAFATGGRTIMGVSPDTAAVELSDAGAAGVGANCGLGPADMLDIIRQMRDSISGIVIAQPNAGLPKMVRGRTVYDCTPDEMAAYAVRFAQLGINMIGACCGSTPEHTRAMGAALNAM